MIITFLYSIISIACPWWYEPVNPVDSVKKKWRRKTDYKLKLRVQLLTDYGTRFNSFSVLVSNCLIDLFSDLPERKSSMSQVPWQGGRCRTETNLNTLQM